MTNDELQSLPEGSFRGVKFHVDTYDRDGGRRGPNHEFPHKDQGYPEDTGKKMEGFSFNAYIGRRPGGADPVDQVNSLIEALNREGPGELSHPVYGTVQVQVRQWSASGSKDLLGIHTFSLSFVEASDPKYPAAQRNQAARMPGYGAAAHRAAGRSFNSNFDIAGRSDFLFNSSVASFNRIGDLFSLASALSGVPVGVTDLLAAVMEALALVSRRSDGDALVDAVAAFPRAITGHFEERHKSTRNADGTYRGTAGLRGNGPLEQAAVTSLYRVFDFESEVAAPLRNTGSRQAQYRNAAAIATLVRQTAIVEAARVAPFVNWQTLQEAEEARDRVTDALEREAWETDDDDLYRSLTDMRTLVLATVAPDNGKLPLLMAYIPKATMPTLALSHCIYGTAKIADELATINGLRHPGFAPGGQEIRILSYA